MLNAMLIGSESKSFKLGKCESVNTLRYGYANTLFRL